METFFNKILKAFLIVLFISSIANGMEQHPSYVLSVSIDPEQGRISGTAEIEIKSDVESVISLGNLRTLSILLDGAPIKSEDIFNELKISSPGILKITYEAVFPKTIFQRGRQRDSQFPINIISPQGISLTHGWYPQIDSIAIYNLKAELPLNFIPISEADDILERETETGKEYAFIFSHPLEGIHLAAAEYIVSKDLLNEIQLFGYFTEEDVHLAREYIDYSKRYIKKYEALFGPYPFKRFSVVENILPTGYSMATFTLLGRDVVRLPFIVETSLGHEILHQWFGNLVYVDYSEGNWVEGLTTYLSDHLYKEERQQGWRYRKDILTNYQSYIGPETKIAVKDFVQRIDFTSKAVGYGKCTMIFHMLRVLIGQNAFFRCLKDIVLEKRFQQTSWTDLRRAFQETSGKQLDWFFQQWLNRTDVPLIMIKDTKVLYQQGIPTVSFTLKQITEHDAAPYVFDIHVMIITDKEKITKALRISQHTETFYIPVKGTPLKLTLDPNYDLMRSLTIDEYSPVLSRLLGDETGITIVGQHDQDTYSDLIDIFASKGFFLRSEDDVEDTEMRNATLLLLGGNNKVYKRLFGSRGNTVSMDLVPDPEVQDQKPDFTLSLRRHPLNPLKVVAIARGTNKDMISTAAKKLSHYGRYSRLTFLNGKNMKKAVVPTDRGIQVDLRHRVKGIQPSKSLDLPDIISNIKDNRVIYVGETHTSYADHRVQLDVIRMLHEGGHKVAVGMEMFQRRFQKDLDNYLSGNTNEKEFLKATEYYKRWKFDYTLYKEIVDYAKVNRIPLRALNIDSEITQKVARGGLDSLSEEEKRQIPPDMDMSDEKYMERLKNIYDQEEHATLSDSGFNNFYQAQIVWDETMAHAIHEFITNFPGYQMVVLAGNGHLMYDSGIPSRVRRLCGIDSVTLITSGTEEMDTEVADYILFPSPLVAPSSPKLGVFIEETELGIRITEFLPDSVAQKAGLKKKDIIIQIDDMRIITIEDLKISLFDKAVAQSIRVKVIRENFFGKKNEKTFDVFF